MKLSCHYLMTLLAVCALQYAASAQDTADSSLINLPSGYFDKVSKNAGSINEKIDSKTAKVLSQLQKRQAKLKRKLFKVDSLAANNIFATADQRVHALEQKLQQPQQLTQYIPFLDSIKTSLQFLEKNKALVTNVKGMQGKLDGSLARVNGLESQLQKAEVVKQFLKQQKQFLKEQLGKFGFAKELKKLNKDVYYYSQQIAEYKETIKDPKKIERKAIAILSRTKLFQDFMKKNSMLASLFRMPADDPNDPAYLQSLAGLQTRAQVNQLVQNQIAAGGAGGQQQIQNNIQQAQGQLQQLKDKMLKYGSSSSDEEIPDFKPNPQKTKTFLQRIEFGTNMQTAKTNNLFPVTSDIGLSAGYKINDNSIIGIGASYKLGWGKNIQHIKISHEGAGIRSFIDWKLKKSLWLSGGYEMNYRTIFNSLEQLKELNAWQQSGLIGFSKKFSIKTKYFKNTKLQLLWDFLSYQQLPRAQPIVFRVGYSF